jgi:hypothetical protein
MGVSPISALVSESISFLSCAARAAVLDQVPTNSESESGSELLSTMFYPSHSRAATATRLGASDSDGPPRLAGLPPLAAVAAAAVGRRPARAARPARGHSG